MQILIYYYKTYTLEIDPQLSIQELKDRIENKIKLPSEKQILFYGGKILNSHALISETGISSGDIIRISARLNGGNFVSTGTLLVFLLSSLVIYYFIFPIIFLGLNYFLLEDAEFSKIELINDSNIWQKLLYYFNTLISNNNIGNKRFQNNSNSPLLLIYILLSLVFWILYSGTITQIIQSYFTCQNKKPNGSTIAWLIIMPILYILLYPLLLTLTRFDFIKKYSVSIFNIFTLIFLSTYYIYTLQTYTFSLWAYLLLSLFILIFYFYFINLKTYNWFKLYLLIPFLGSLGYITIYLKDYFNNFSELC